MASLLQPVEDRLQAPQLGYALAVVHAAAQGILHGLRLFENLLEHEVRELAAIDRLRAAFEQCGFPAYRLVIQSLDPKPARLEACHFVVLKINNLVRVLCQSADVGSRQGFVLSDTQYNGTSPASHDDLVRMAAVHDRDPVRALHLEERLLHGGLEVALIVLFHKMRQNLSVRFRTESMT